MTLRRQPTPVAVRPRLAAPCADPRRFAAMLAIAFLLTSVGLLATPRHARLGRERFSSASEKQLVSLTNQARASAGLKSLKVDSTLTAIARSRSKDMIVRDYFSHTILGNGYNVFHVLDQKGYCYRIAGENIGWNNYPGRRRDVRRSRSQFMDSPGHRANILGKAWDVDRDRRLQGRRRQEDVDRPLRRPLRHDRDAEADPEADAEADPQADAEADPRRPTARADAEAPPPSRRPTPTPPTRAGADRRLGLGLGPGGQHDGNGNGADNGDGGSSGDGPPPGQVRDATPGTAEAEPAGRSIRRRAPGLFETVVGGVTGLPRRLTSAAGGPIAARHADGGRRPPATLGRRWPPILEAHDLAKRYRLGATTVDALRGVSLTVDEGEFVALMGPSGSGKSTLLQLLGGLDRPTAGEVVLQGETISQLVRRRGDEAAPRPDRVRLPVVQPDPAPRRHRERRAAVHDRRRRPGKGELAERIRDVIALVDLAGKEHHKPDQLSAGEQQRVAIARALVTRPALLFADEPTGNLDYTTGTEILEALWRSCVERNQTIVLVTHDSKAAAYADRVLVISDGRIRDEIALGRRDDHDTAPLVEPPRRARALGPCRAALISLALRSLARAPRPDAPVDPRGRARDRRALRVARHRRRDHGIDRSDGPRPRRPRRPPDRGVRDGRPVRESLAAIEDAPGVVVAAPALERRTYLSPARRPDGPAAPVTALGVDPGPRRGSATSSIGRAGLSGTDSPRRSSPRPSPRATGWTSAGP